MGRKIDNQSAASASNSSTRTAMTNIDAAVAEEILGWLHVRDLMSGDGQGLYWATPCEQTALGSANLSFFTNMHCGSNFVGVAS